MILDRELAVNAFEFCRSRYKAMIRSTEAEDRANAEAPRLASEIWDLLAYDLAERRAAQMACRSGPGYAPGAPAAGVEAIDLPAYCRRLAELWERYTSTYEIISEGEITLAGEIAAAEKPQLLDESLRDYVYPRGMDRYIVEMRKLLRIEDEDAVPTQPGPPETPAAEPVRVGGRSRATAGR